MDMDIVIKFGIEGHLHRNGGGWVANTAHVDVSALVSGDAQVYGNARVSGNAQVYGNALVYGDAQVSGNAQVTSHIGEKYPWNGVTFAAASFTATVNDDSIQIGCHMKLIRDWLKVKKSEAISLGLPGHFYAQYAAFVRMVAEAKRTE
jgi:hypothetical protein